jgi:hypothetical protein
MWIRENLLDRRFECGGDPIGKVEGRIVPLRLQGVDGAAGHAHLRGKLLLRPTLLRSEHSEPALHGSELLMNGVTMPNTPQKSG